MSFLLNVLFYFAVCGSVTSTIYSGMVVVAAMRFWYRRRRAGRTAADQLPCVSVLKPLHGLEADLERNLATFFEQDYPAKYELLFCARHATDEGLQLARRVAARYPAVDARFVTCGEPRFPNAKMWSLAALAEAAHFDVLVTSDADARVERNHLRECVAGLGESNDLESCLYIGKTDGDGLGTELDALGKSVEMTGGALVADMLEGTKFALGVTMVLRRNAFRKAGGYEELGQYWAEDFVLGNRLAERGFGVGLSGHVIRLMVPPSSFGVSFENQLRWMKSTRMSRPAGHLGTGLTFAVPFGLLGLVWSLATGHWAVGLLWLAGVCAARCAMATTMLRVLGDEAVLRGTLLYPLRDLLGGVVWVGSYCGNTMSYHGGAYVLEAGGRFRRRPRATAAVMETQSQRTGT